jgi:tRNA pseudouridine38-40 synthase
MPRYFLEVSYKGTAYSGFQVQKNANSIQAEIEKALSVFFKQAFSLTGSSRTDTGVHALQNYFHFDTIYPLNNNKDTIKLQSPKVPSPGGDLGEAGFIYNLNAILPLDIVIKRIFPVDENAHCRFDAVSREYNYFIYRDKNPFLEDRAYYFPYTLDLDKLKKASKLVLLNKDFTSFSKRNTQVKNFICGIKKSEWMREKDTLVYQVESNRFLRGMVKGLVGTMLRVGTGKITLNQFEDIIKNRDCTKADFSVPPHALFLMKVAYDIF